MQQTVDRVVLQAAKDGQADCVKQVPLRMDEFMFGMMNAPYNADICRKCGGTGLEPVMCCSGHECGCMGQPTDFTDCECGCQRPSDAQIRTWSAQE